jgi:hypothetical protein
MFTGEVQQVTLPAGTVLQPQGPLLVGADGGEDPGAQGNEGSRNAGEGSCGARPARSEPGPC